MELSQISKMQDDARSMARAAQYLGKAANELAPVALPAARDALARTPGRISALASRVRSLTPERLRKRQAVVAACAGVAAAGLVAAAVAHVVHHRKAAALYASAKRSAEAERQLRADRERTIADASFDCTAQEFLAAVAADELPDDFAPLSAPGCFAICVYGEAPEKGDYDAFKDVYVGASTDMAAAAEKQLRGEGNLYVHADVVYGQPLRLFFFPCEGYEVYARKEGLVRSLAADDSYNKITEIADLD